MTDLKKKRRWGVAVFGAAVAAAIPWCAAGSATADPPPTPYPVPYHFLLDAATSALQGAGAAPPGTNDWGCRPTPEHPEPVVLVHGFLANRTDNWQTYGPLLANNGYCVFALTYGNDNGGSSAGFVGGLASMESSARTLDAFVDRVLDATGARKVDIVGHSEGATMPY
ncbi:esterase/lipase family protein [Nocardia sp. alder85J]|uniref:esterase/lipase family protein n=1 Tax=Nocardia sp. alder85J TaxID=2862949 RepID=UPI001CD6C3A3|nr:alpha/beta fold hydrolase [Nocardia sp. alder85J]MCX4096743.1 alpha/beta fold hydrolase [Nocardia sp. alder85J]